MMNVSTANNFTKTIVVLKFADSLIPTMRIVVTIRMAMKASRLKAAV